MNTMIVGQITGKVAWSIIGTKIACIDRRYDQEWQNDNTFQTLVEIGNDSILRIIYGADRVQVSIVENDSTQYTRIIVRENNNTIIP